MTVTPKVYRFSPGAKTGMAVVNGVKRCMDATGIHHWEVVPGSFTPDLTITLRDKATLQRQLRLVALTSGSPSPSVACYYSAAAGANENPVAYITGGDFSTTLSSSTGGMSTNEAYVVEIEDAISILFGKGTDGATGFLANSLGRGMHAGRIFSAHNRSDMETFGEQGILCGILACTTGTTGASYQLSTDTTTGGNAQRYLLAGSDWVRACVGVSSAGQRDSLVSAQRNLLANVGDNGSIERLVPYPITGPVTGTTSGHTCYTRYVRTRYYGVGDVGPDGLSVANGLILASQGSPTTIGWRHNQPLITAAATNMRNLLHIWCPPGQEVIVD